MVNNDFRVLEHQIKSIVSTDNNYKESIIRLFKESSQLEKDKIAMIAKNIKADWIVETIIEEALENPHSSAWILFAMTELEKEKHFQSLVKIGMAGGEDVKLIATEIINSMMSISKTDKTAISELCAFYKRNDIQNVESIAFINNCIYVANTLPLSEINPVRQTAKIYQFPKR